MNFGTAARCCPSRVEQGSRPRNWHLGFPPPHGPGDQNPGYATHRPRKINFSLNNPVDTPPSHGPAFPLFLLHRLLRALPLFLSRAALSRFGRAIAMLASARGCLCARSRAVFECRQPRTFNPTLVAFRGATAKPMPSRKGQQMQDHRMRWCCQNDRLYSQPAWCLAPRQCRQHCRRCRARG